MPSYTVYTAADCLDGAQQAALARSITVVHSEHTGAPRSFVQTIFLPVAPGAHFIGAEPAHPRSLWVYGHIRSGRPAQVRTAIAEGITTAAEEVAGIPRQHIWVYLNELARTDMVEFGAVLPPPGEEAAWIDRLPPGDPGSRALARLTASHARTAAAPGGPTAWPRRNPQVGSRVGSVGSARTERPVRTVTGRCYLPP